MGRLILLLIPWILSAQPVPPAIEITYKGESAVAIRTILQGFASLGYRLDLESVETHGETGVLRGRAVGYKPLDPRILVENLQENGVVVERAGIQGSTLILATDARKGAWNVTLVGADEGSELQKVAAPQWFRIQENQTIRIQPPYASRWYPEIAVLGQSMEVLYSNRSTRPEDTFELALPSGAAYLKVSNTNGMKLLREGMWIESLSPGR